MNAEKSSQDRATVWVILPFALAIVGTVVMLFTNSANILKVSLVFALWAAVAGILLVTRLRSDKERAERELEARSQGYESQLEAVHARSEADRAALALARNDESVPSGVELDVLREIQAELAQLRAQLEQLSGRQFEYERAALRAEARRVAELESRPEFTARTEEPVFSDPVPAELEPHTGSTRVHHTPVEPTSKPSEPRTAFTAKEPALHTSAPDTPNIEKPNAEKPSAVRVPSMEDTSEIKQVADEAVAPAPTPTSSPVHTPPASTPAAKANRPTGAPNYQAAAGSFGASGNDTSEWGSNSLQANNPLSQLISERQAEQVAQSMSEPATKKPAAQKPAAQKKTTPPVETATPAQSWGSNPGGGRRRRDERGRSSLSVAELLARSQRNADEGRS